MATVQQVSRHVRSKNAGPFWVSTDIFFSDAQMFQRYAATPKLGADVIAALYGVDAAQVKHYPVESLNVLKISYPRPWPQGGEVERDMHCGNQCKRLLNLELD